jgi:hypothetical protein
MDLSSAAGSFFAAFGLSGAAGLNAWLPLFAAALLDRTDVVHLGAPFDQLSTTSGIVVLGVLLVADFVGDKVPAVDHALHAIGAVVHPASGAALFAGQTGLHTDIPALVSIVLGGGIAGALHAVRALLRPASTVTTAGIATPFVSLTEDVASALLIAVAFLAPLLGFLLVAALLVAAALGFRRLRRAVRNRRGRTQTSS